MFHVELRRFPHLARVFNLSPEELQGRFLAPWISGGPILVDDQRWTSEKTRLTIYEGREVAAEERGLGRGWSIVTRSGKDVTRDLLAAATESSPLVELKRRLLEAAPLRLGEAVTLGDALRASERMALAEQAVWELLHEQRLVLVREGASVAREEWQPLLLDWESWSDPQTVLEPSKAT